MHCRQSTMLGRRPLGGSIMDSPTRKSAWRRRFSRSAVRARQRDGLSRGDHRPPDGGALRL